MISKSCLYFGSVMHRRLRPRRHSLRYRIFWVLWDLDELDKLNRGLPCFGYNRFNVLSLYDRDYGDGSATPLRAQIDLRLAEAGIQLHGGTVHLLSMPRLFGYAFNPIAVYFCRDRHERLVALIYEVHNTFGERHSYIFTIEPEQYAERHRCRKTFHVSPFLQMGLHYEFRTAMPEQRLSVAIVGSDDLGPLITAVMTGDRKPLTAKYITQALIMYPLLNFKVVAAIHLNALLLWGKRIRIHHKPEPPSSPVTIASVQDWK